MKLLLTRKELLAETGMTRKQMERFVETGELKPVRLMGYKRWQHFSRLEVQAFLEKLKPQQHAQQGT